MTKAYWEDWKLRNEGNFSALKDLAENEGCEDVLCNVISNDYVNSLAKEYIDNFGWKSAFNLLKDIADSDSKFYEIDEIGSLSVVDKWSSYADDVEDYLVFDDE